MAAARRSTIDGTSMTIIPPRSRTGSIRSVALTCISVTALVIAACQGESVTGPDETGVKLPLDQTATPLAAFLCRANPATLSLACDPAPDPLGLALPSYNLGVEFSDASPQEAIIFGGQNVNVLVASSNITNDTITHHFGFDVTIKNLRPQPIGTTNGTTSDSSLTVFFHSGPTTTGGSGLISVFNATGTGTFTGPGQPFFTYGERLAQNQTSAPKNWILQYDATVTTFSFLLLISANVQYPNGYIDVYPQSGGTVNAGATLQMTDSVRDALGVVTGDQSETWSLSDSSKATIDAAGLLTGVAPGTVLVTATQGLKTGSASVEVTGSTPNAVGDSSAENSAPGVAYHTALNTLYSGSAPGVLSNDAVGSPAGTVASYGADSLGGAVTDHAAGTTVTPLPGHPDGSLTVNADGSIAFTPPAGFTGYYAFKYRLTNALGSSDAQVKIAVGVRVSATNSTYTPHLLGNVGINTSTSTNTKLNATGDALTYNLVGATNGEAVLHTDGTFEFKPNVGYTGAGVITYTAKNGFGTTPSTTVSLTVDAPRIWFVASGGSGDGRYGTPLGCIVGASGCLSNQTLNSNDIVHIGSGTYSNTANLNLTVGMRVIGQGASGLFAASTNANVTWPADAGAQPATGGARPRIDTGSSIGVFVLATGNNLRGLIAGLSAGGSSISGSAVGSFSMSDAAIVNTSGGAISLTTSGTLAVTLDSIVAAGTTGINLVSQTGTFTSALTKVSGTSSTGINVTNSAGFSFGTTFVKKTSAGTAINLATNSGTTSFASLVDSTTSGTALLTSSAGTVSIGGGLLHAVGGPAIDATSTTFSGAGFTSTTSTGSAGRGVSLTTVSGTLALGGGSIGTAATEDFFVSGGGGTITYGGNINNTASRSVSISGITGGSITLSGSISDTGTGLLVQNSTGGTVSFTGATKVFNTGANVAINLSTNTNATISFIDSVSVTTTTGNGLSATGGGTVSVIGTHNSISSGSGTALNVQNTTIGASGLNFRSISANGGTNGIVLSNTGTGVLAVSGSGSSASGGTIQNVSLEGITLTDVQSPSFSWMSISNTGRTGIKGRRVKNFTLANSSINNVGTAAAGQYDESNISFNDGGVFTDSAVSGTISITNNSLTNARRHGIDIENGKGTIINLTITGNTLTSSTVSTTSLGTAILILQQGSASTTAHLTTGSISTNTITNFPSGEGIAVLGGSGNGSNNTSGTIGANGTPVVISGNAISGGAGRLGSNAIRTSFNGQVGVANFTISNNGTIASPITNIEGQGISVFMGGTVTGTTTINNNVIVANQTLAAGTQGLAVQIDDGPAGLGTSAADYNISITNNRVSNYEGNGIRAIARASNGKMDVTIQNNVVGTPILANRNGIRVDAGSAAGDVTVCLAMSGNTSDGSGVNQGIGLRKQGTVATTNDFGIVGLSPSPTTAANAAARVAADNPAGGGVDIISGDNYTTCSISP